MDFQILERVEHPLDKVYIAYRDRLEELVPFLPNVDSIEIREREKIPNGVRLVNRWQISGAVPKVVRAFLSAQKLSYLDYAVWNNAAHHVEWHFEIGMFPDAVDCHGIHYFRGNDNSTEVEFTGTLTVDLARIRGVPRFLRGLGPTVESYLLKQMRPNMSAISQAVGRLLDSEKTE